MVRGQVTAEAETRGRQSYQYHKFTVNHFEAKLFFLIDVLWIQWNDRWGIQLEMILYYFDDSKAQMDRKRGIWTCCLEKIDHGTYNYMQAHLKKNPRSIQIYRQFKERQLKDQ